MNFSIFLPAFSVQISQNKFASPSVSESLVHQNLAGDLYVLGHSLHQLIPLWVATESHFD